jgi:hypothetical protein
MRPVAVFALAVLASAQSQREPLRVPEWFVMFEPENQAIAEKTPDLISLSYDADEKFIKIVGEYENILHRSKTIGVSLEEGGNREGTFFYIGSSKVFCQLFVLDRAKPHVDLKCEDGFGQNKSAALPDL